ncbi:alpha-glucosidase [uncultured Robinsoniella sp.]|uniref:glycoside hydrolase family 13 protein n=1 Tax=uncultured Robinsoniella sp. TaxID=904190 RepID=UPI00374FAA54
MKKTWWKESVVYQIYPRSFKDSNGDGIGDLGGIIEKLDYLKELGADVLWLSPIYQSPNDDNGYDISSYQEIMSEFGTMEDFDALLEGAHQRGLKIMLDLVVNHSSDEHEWFQMSRRKEANPCQDFYIWEKEKPNNWESYFGGSAWEYDEEKEMYYLHLFSKKQPDFNWDNPKLRQKIYEMMTWWMEKGIDGFRMDVINLISKVPEFPEGEVIEGTPYTEKAPYVVCGPHMHDYLKEMNEQVLSRYDMMTVGEGLGLDVDQARNITDENENELNMMFTFEHVNVEGDENGKWSDQRFDLVKLKEILAKWQEGLAGAGWNSLYWENHDQPRVVSRFGDDGVFWEESAKMLATCLHMMRGTPYIYQGEEIGMTNIRLKSVYEYEDIETKAAYERYTKYLGYSDEKMLSCIHAMSRDNARTPMQWEDSPHGGFTSGTPWFGVNPNYTKINAAAQVKDEASIFHYYKQLIQLRKRFEIIVYGDFQLLLPEDRNLFVYERSYEDQKLLTVCNFAAESIEFEVPDSYREKEAGILICNYEMAGYENVMQLRPYEARVYLLEL